MISKTLLPLTVLSLICMIFAGLSQATPLKKGEPFCTNGKNLTFTDLSAVEVKASFVWHFGALVPDKIVMNMVVEFLEEKKDVSRYEFQLLNIQGALAFDMSKEIQAGSVCKGNYAFLTEEFAGINNPTDLQGFTLVISSHGTEVGRSTIS
ncbi:360_t:CDS:1 [Cetraspora pellucida]|uniref:360_t:CDS:1 n=1 Tax=Cetraspora pellucida TaxID=1433469 RepID=A0ACA9KFK4_9GLOM|nr:360_t:CDS:1 [Cetraspora pellucida]